MSIAEVPPISEAAPVRVAASAAPAQPPAEAPSHPSAPTPNLGRIADENVWNQLLNRALKHPTQTQPLRVGRTDYTVYIVHSDTPVDWEICPKETTVRNTLYVAKTLDGPGGDVNPVRVTAVCMARDGARNSFEVDADMEGRILSAETYDPSFGIVTRLPPDAFLPASNSSSKAFLSRLVKLFLETP